MVAEFDVIDRFFRRTSDFQHAQTVLGNGDDASIHRLEQDQEIVVSTDISVAGIHWPTDFPLDAAAERAVGAALSDLAAMGAQPAWAWVGVQAVDVDDIEAMATGVVAALNRWQVELAGGDTVSSRGNSLSVTVAGMLPAGEAMRRDAARIGDEVWLCGRIGFAAFGLQQWNRGRREGDYIDAFKRISPLIEAGTNFRQLGVRCCIDVSDGLIQDAGHIARASDVCLELESESFPGLDVLSGASSREYALACALTGGEDYALLFTAAPELSDQLSGLASRIGCCSGKDAGVVWMDGKPEDRVVKGYDHFSDRS